MTREEAIQILKKHHMWTGEPQELIEVREENEALAIAISALSENKSKGYGRFMICKGICIIAPNVRP